MSRITLEAIHSGEIRSQVFDFSSQCSVGETLSSASTAATVYSGTDPIPIVILQGPAAISGQKVTQAFGGSGLSGVVYLITVTAVTSLSQTLKLIAYLPFIPANQ